MNLKRKRLIIVVSSILVIAITIVVAVTQSPKWSRLSFEAIVQETVIQPDGEVRLIIKRTTKVYADPLNSLHIDENTKLLGDDGKLVSIGELQPGYKVKVTLENSFIEEVPFYYPIVYEVKLLSDDEG